MEQGVTKSAYYQLKTTVLNLLPKCIILNMSWTMYYKLMWRVNRWKTELPYLICSISCVQEKYFLRIWIDPKQFYPNVIFYTKISQKVENNF